MKVLSLQVGGPQKIEWQGRSIQTSMLKSEVSGPLKVSMTSIEGDRFANSQFHGTPDSVIYALAREAYSQMGARLNKDLIPGCLGENLTMDKLDEVEIEIGDVFRIDTVEAEVTGPRVPCEKLNFVNQHVDAQMAFVKIKRPGIYFRILKSGEIHRGAELFPIKKSGSGLSLHELYTYITDLRIHKKCDNPKRFFEILEHPLLVQNLKESLMKHANVLKIQKP